MRKTTNVFLFFLSVVLFGISLQGFAQGKTPTLTDSLKLRYPIKDSKSLVFGRSFGLSLPNPANIKRSVVFNPFTKQYTIQDSIGGQFFRNPYYLTIPEYQRFENKQLLKNTWRDLADQSVSAARQN